MTTFDRTELCRVPRLSFDVRLRREDFGGLVFKAGEMAVYETNDLSYRLLSVVDGLRSLEDVIQFGVQELGGTRPTVERVLKDTIQAGVLLL